MRTKLSKRILSVLLAALMVVTSVPLMSFSAFAADTDAVTDPEVLAAQEAMQAFADKLATEGAAYGNVEPAYNAYVDVQEAIDAYYYGGADVSVLQNAVTALNNASNQMTTFTGYSVDNSIYSTEVWSDDYGPDNTATTDDYLKYYKNVLWIDNGYNPSFGDFMSYSNCDMVQQDRTGVTTALAYPSAVLLYDGVNTPATSVMAVAQGDGRNIPNADRYVYAISSNSSDLTLAGNWKSGNGGTLDHIWNMDSNSTVLSMLNSGFNGCSAIMIADYGYVFPSFRVTHYTYRFSNMFTFTGTMASNEYSRMITPSITSYNGSNTSFRNDDIVQTVTGTRQIYVLNATILTSAVEANGSKMKSIDLANYSEGGLLEYIQAMDALTAFDFNSYFDNGNNYENCVTDMRAVVTAANNAATNIENSSEYANLRVAMDSKKASYNNGENAGFTDDSYGELVAAYEEAMRVMNALTTSGYTDSDGAQAAADALNAVELVTNVEKVDTAALEAVIDAFEGYTNIFTSESYSQADQTVEAAKAAVWGSADRYKDAASALDASDENNALVAEQIAAIENAVKGLRVNPDASIVTQYGRYSLNSAIALKDAIEDPTAFYNYASFQSALNDAVAARDQLASLEFTDYDTLYAEYLQDIEILVAAYNALEYSFTRIPDGTIAKAGSMTSITPLVAQDQGSQYVNFSYPTNVVVFKTSHGESTIKYGDANIGFSTNIHTLDNNSLDSITINATAADIGGQRHINTTYPTASSTPPALSDSEKQTYAGCLAVNGFSLSNLRYTGSNANVANQILTLSDGTAISDDATARQTDLTSILGTTDGASSNPARGAVFAKSSGDDLLAETYITADMNVTDSGTAAQELSASTTPETRSYILSGTYFGAVTTWNCQNVFNYSGYNWLTSQVNNEQIYSTVQVIDISYLVDLVATCNALLDDSAKYTDSSFAAFTTALEAAQEDLPYAGLNASTILIRCQTRYRNLWNAYQDLAIKTLPVTFNYKDTDASDASAVINVEYGKTLTDYADEINAIDYPETYVSADGAYTYTFINWSPEVDLDTPVTAARTYTAQYESELNKADFTAYNNATAQLLGALTDEVYSVADLEELKAAIEGMTYYDMPEEERDELMGDVQASINAETEAINALRESLTPAEVDIDAAKAAAEEAKAGKDEDVYNLSTLDFTYTSVVNVGGKDVVGLTFATQEEVDAAIAEFLNNLNKNVYTIYLNGSPVGTAEYGTPVIVGSDGAFAANVSDIDSTECDGEKSVAWSYSYSAPSRDGEQTEAKYMLTAKALGFIVKGNTYLTTANATSDEEGYVVKFATNGGKIFDVQYTTNGKVTVPDAPNYAFYTFTGYEGGYTAGEEIDVSADTTIVANYEADTANTYTIDYFASLNDDWYGGVATRQDVVQYNTRLDYSNPDAYCWAIASMNDDGYEYYKIVALGTEYSFYACQNISYDDTMGLVSLTREDYEMFVEYQTAELEGNPDADLIIKLVDANDNIILAEIDDFMGTYTYVDPNPAVMVQENVVPIYDENNKFSKFSMIGTFVLPEDYTLVECGILFSSNQAADLTVENVGNDGVARMKASSYTCGNQFVINVKAPSSGAAVNFKYSGYAIVKDADGNLTTLYSKSVMGTTEGF